MKVTMIFSYIFWLFLIVWLPSCGSEHRLKSQIKQYEQAQQVYYAIMQEYTSELTLCVNHEVGTDQIRRCVLTHADQVRKTLGFGSFMTGRASRYTSYPFLAYTKDLDDTVATLNRALRKLVPYDAHHCVDLCTQMQELRHCLQEFRTYVISHDRYLVEQDKWDATILEQNKQAALNAVLAQNMNTKSAQVHVYHKK
jgi:hypothetical protein